MNTLDQIIDKAAGHVDRLPSIADGANGGIVIVGIILATIALWVVHEFRGKRLT